MRNIASISASYYPRARFRQTLEPRTFRRRRCGRRARDLCVTMFFRETGQRARHGWIIHTPVIRVNGNIRRGSRIDKHVKYIPALIRDVLMKGRAKYSVAASDSSITRLAPHRHQSMEDTSTQYCCALAAPVSGCSAEEAEKVGAGDLGSISVGPQPGINRRMETRSGGGGDGKRERDDERSGEGKFMCLGRVKGTRVATSAADGRRTAGWIDATRIEGGRQRRERARAEGWMHLHVIETNSILRIVPDARGHDGPLLERGICGIRAPGKAMIIGGTQNP